MKKLLVRGVQGRRRFKHAMSFDICRPVVYRTRIAWTVLVVLLLLESFSAATNATSDDCKKRALPAGISIQEQARALRNSQPALIEREPNNYSLRATRDVHCTPLLRNFDRFSSNVYRGGQPILRPQTGVEKADGIALLHAMGVTDIINLRNPSKGEFEPERARSTVEGISFHSFPLPSLDFGIPGLGKKISKRVNNVAQAVALAQKLESDGRVVYIHCTHGADRTGVVVALMRLLDGATLQTAMTEAKDHSISPFQIGMRNFIKHYADPEHLKEFRSLVESYKKSL